MNNEHENIRRHHSPEEKVKILRLHMLDGQQISGVCEKHQINPMQFLSKLQPSITSGRAADNRNSRALS